MDYSREEIVHQLERVEQEGAYVGLARRERLAKDINEGKVTDLVAGVTRQRRWLDFIVDQFYASKSTKLEPRVRIILRMGIFEILETRAAHHAVVNETVNCAKRMVGKQSTMPTAFGNKSTRLPKQMNFCLRL